MWLDRDKEINIFEHQNEDDSESPLIERETREHWDKAYDNKTANDWTTRQVMVRGQAEGCKGVATERRKPGQCGIPGDKVIEYLIKD